MGLESLTSVVIPVYNEGPNIQTCVRRVHEALQEHPHEILVCYDFEGDDTLQALTEMRIAPQPCAPCATTWGEAPPTPCARVSRLPEETSW